MDSFSSADTMQQCNLNPNKKRYLFNAVKMQKQQRLFSTETHKAFIKVSMQALNYVAIKQQYMQVKNN